MQYATMDELYVKRSLLIDGSCFICTLKIQIKQLLTLLTIHLRIAKQAYYYEQKKVFVSEGMTRKRGIMGKN